MRGRGPLLARSVAGGVAGVVVVVCGALSSASCTTPPSPGALVVVTAWPGQRAADVEQSVTLPIEHAAAALAGVDHVAASSTSGTSTVVVVVAPKQSVLHVADALRTSLARVAKDLPADVLAPMIIRRERGMRVAARFVLTSSTLPRVELTHLAEGMAEAIERTPGVAAVAVKNGAHRELQVRVDGARAKAMNVSIAAVADVLRGYPAKNIVDLAAVPISRVPEVHVSDVATIGEAVLDDGSAAPVLLEVTQQAGAALALATPAAPAAGVDVRALPLDDDAPLAVVLTGPPDEAGRDALAAKARALIDDNMAGNAGFHWTGATTSGATTPGAGVPEATVEIDRDRASALGVSVADAAAALRVALGGEIVVRIDDVPVRVSQPVDEHAPLGRQVHVASRTGALVPLADVARETVGAQQQQLRARYDNTAALALCGAVHTAHGRASSDDVAAAAKAVSGRLRALALPPGAAVAVIDDAAAVGALCPGGGA